MNIRTLKRSVLGACAGAALLAATGDASAFTTGVHFTICEHAFLRSGFSGQTLRIVQAANYNVDYIANIPNAVLFGNTQRAKNESHYFHFDALQDAQKIEREFAWHSAAMKKTVEEAVAARDVSRIVYLLGIESHAIQDFYSHANFADMDWNTYVGSTFPTWDAVPRDMVEDPLIRNQWGTSSDWPGLFSGVPSQPPYSTVPNSPGHGDSTGSCVGSIATCGVNHDAPARRASLTATLMATQATMELIARTKAIVNNDSTWSTIQHYGTNNDPGTDQAWARAQAISTAAGMWGFSTGKSYIDLALETYKTICGPTDSYCPLNAWDANWGKALFALFDAAPPGFAEGGGQSYPPQGTPIFQLPTTPLSAMAGLAGSYLVTVGARSGTMVLNVAGATYTGTISLQGTAANILSIYPRGSGFDVTIAATTVLGKQTARLYPVGAPQGALAGFMRTNADGVPEGFHASRGTVIRPPGANEVR